MRVLVTALIAVPLLTLVPAGAGEAAAGSCQGRPATIEATGGTVTGTEGPDVILVTGPATVEALGGDDTVCVAGGRLDAGAGDDEVSAVGAHEQIAVLGAGDDTYTSVGLTDDVDPHEGDSAGTDTVDTGDGPDEVHSGTVKEPNHDHVTTFSVVKLEAPAGSDAQLSGGGGVYLDTRDSASYVFNAMRGTLERNGEVVASYDPSHLFGVEARRARVTVHGTVHSESVDVHRAAAFRADLQAGVDLVYLHPGSPKQGRIDGGGGKNYLEAHAKDEAVGDLSRHTLALTSQGRVSRWTVTRFANLHVSGLRINIQGSSAANTIVGFGCDVTLRGLGGKDHLVVGRFERGWPSGKRCDGGPRGHLYGGGANDTLEGGGTGPMC
jgi:hypothetical protein